MEELHHGGVRWNCTQKSLRHVLIVDIKPNSIKQDSIRISSLKECGVIGAVGDGLRKLGSFSDISYLTLVPFGVRVFFFEFSNG